MVDLRLPQWCTVVRWLSCAARSDAYAQRAMRTQHVERSLAAAKAPLASVLLYASIWPGQIVLCSEAAGFATTAIDFWLSQRAAVDS